MLERLDDGRGLKLVNPPNHSQPFRLPLPPLPGAQPGHADRATLSD